MTEQDKEAVVHNWISSAPLAISIVGAVIACSLWLGSLHARVTNIETTQTDQAEQRRELQQAIDRLSSEVNKLSVVVATMRGENAAAKMR